ncbi:hypothetical protein GGI25_004400 [Coemansia spiralis]|uniref:DH domain-containing protein n=2 Tax=Coemansia TaxID=4863 RepID=A0A9W8G4A1_9FUNG|nr:hypothetical protein BX070DRAFT_234328 [Coemansia spiralis]KAJ1995352.1 hypothetical protein EDC05_000904 [Coemansia umbellata]KAJ2624821.1 hypothetical protein GGI26_001237 [Coemansia sp. RSA 1358]KAJ2674379.1 hypothetical protein GGI25_004400 [Coemansia spiralis]
MVNLPLARSIAHSTGDGTSDGSPQRPSIDIRRDAVVASSSPAKARMLWREGFTPTEIENSSINAKEVRRQEVIFEIIHTEADYVKDLRITVDILLAPMHSLKVLPAEQIELVFGNVREILELHEAINHAFMERQRQQYPVLWDIADVLLPFVPHFRVYAKYICNQDNALRLVDELRRTSNNFAVFWKERQTRPECRSLPIEAFLALPFQRLLKYPLLLRTLLDATDGWTQQHANGRLVADQVDAWIRKIQDARAKLDSYACLTALAAAVDGVDWQPLLQGEHRLVHSGAVTVTNPALAANGCALPPGEAATMWLFDDFFIVARPEPHSSSRSVLPRTSFSSPPGQDQHQQQAKQPRQQGGASYMPTPGTRYALVHGPCQLVEVLELAQCKGSPAAYLKAIPYNPHSPGAGASAGKTSLVVRFKSKSDYTLWRGKLDEHVRRTLTEQPLLSADILADAIARAKIIDSGPAQCIGITRSPPSSGLPSAQPSAMASVNDIPTISVRDVYVPFPAARQKGKLRRGWDFLCSKTEDITGQGIKRQLKKYGGGGGGKRRATEAPPEAMRRRLSRSRPRRRDPPIALAKPPLGVASTAMVVSPQSPSFVHIPKLMVPSVANGGREPSIVPLHATAALQPRNLAVTAPSISHPQLHAMGSSSSSRFEASMESVALRPHIGYARRSEDTTASASVSGATVLTGNTLLLAADDALSDSELSSSELSAVFPEHVAERSGSTLFVPPPQQQSPASIHSGAQTTRVPGWRPKPLPIPPGSRGSVVAARKPAPIFEFGSAKLTLGGSPDRRAHRPPSFASASSGLKTWGTSAQDLLNSMPGFQSSSSLEQWPRALRNWPPADTDNPSSANSTDSFCIVNHEPQTPVRRRSVGRKDDRMQSMAARIGGSSFEA